MNPLVHQSGKSCRVCHQSLQQLFRSTLPIAVSSACSLVSGQATVKQCRTCGLLQKTETDLIADYHNYDLFDNDPLADKLVVKPGCPTVTRSQFLAQLLVEQIGIDTQARVLEVGCHRGAFLAALKALCPTWELAGFDVEATYSNWIEPICGSGRYYSGNLRNVPGSFQVIILIHTLEHVPFPSATLQEVYPLLDTGGLLIVVVPDTAANPADLYTIDHTCHFTASTLRRVLEDSGFTGEIYSEMIGNELIAVARRVEYSPATGSTSPSACTGVGQAEVNIASLHRLERGLNRITVGSCHVFGTALLGSLVGGFFAKNCLGYADESSFRVGKKFQGFPIRHPRELAGERILMGVSENLAGTIGPRLSEMGLEVIDPWEIGKADP